jgi:hypothetical protein
VATVIAKGFTFLTAVAGFALIVYSAAEVSGSGWWAFGILAGAALVQAAVLYAPVLGDRQKGLDR